MLEGRQKILQGLGQARQLLPRSRAWLGLGFAGSFQVSDLELRVSGLGFRGMGLRLQDYGSS